MKGRDGLGKYFVENNMFCSLGGGMAVLIPARIEGLVRTIFTFALAAASKKIQESCDED